MLKKNPTNFRIDILLFNITPYLYNRENYLQGLNQ